MKTKALTSLQSALLGEDGSGVMLLSQLLMPAEKQQHEIHGSSCMPSIAIAQTHTFSAVHGMKFLASGMVNQCDVHEVMRPRGMI